MAHNEKPLSVEQAIAAKFTRGTIIILLLYIVSMDHGTTCDTYMEQVKHIM